MEISETERLELCNMALAGVDNITGIGQTFLTQMIFGEGKISDFAKNQIFFAKLALPTIKKVCNYDEIKKRIQNMEDNLKLLMDDIEVYER